MIDVYWYSISVSEITSQFSCSKTPNFGVLLQEKQDLIPETEYAVLCYQYYYNCAKFHWASLNGS